MKLCIRINALIALPIERRAVKGKAMFALAALLIIALPATGLAQNCKKLTPAGQGQDDSATINECLRSKGRAKLRDGAFLLYGPIIFPRSNKTVEVSDIKLIGKGSDRTRLVVQADCDSPWPFVAGQDADQYQPVIQIVKSPNAVVEKLEIDLTNLRQDCGYLGNYTIFVNQSPGSEIDRLRIKGSQYATDQYTTGGANGGGIRIVNSSDCIISDNTITDVGFAKENGTGSAGYAGISLENSGDSLVENNDLVRVAFGINITNSSPQHGFSGDSSGAIIRGNNITGAGRIDCPNCSQGRAIKLQACAVGDELRLEKIIVSNNTATDFGGTNGAQGGSGLDLVCGVRYSAFENNIFIGASTAEFGLQIRSSFLSPRNTTHHNQFSFNTFLSGRGFVGCNNECADVNFTRDGPDQIGIRRNGQDRASTNTAASFRSASDRGCNDYSHAFFNYLGEKNFVRQDESLLLAASGVRPFTSVRFRFIREEDGSEVAAYDTQPASRNCVVNQENIFVDARNFSPGLYKIFADYQDGNSDALIDNDPIGVMKVKAGKQD